MGVCATKARSGIINGYTDRIYKAIGLNIRRKAKKRLPARIQQPLQVPVELNHTWLIDFRSDALENGIKFRSTHVLNDYYVYLN